MRQLSPEGVMSVNPGAIIALEGSGPREAIDVLKKASVPFVMVPEKFDRDGIVEKIKIVGHALGAEDKAAELAKSVETDIDAAEALTAKVGERKRVLFILSTQGGKVLAAGSGTAADGIIAMAGAQNVVSDFSGYKQLSDEAIVTAQPDFILMMDRGGGDHAAVNRDAVRQPRNRLDAGRAGKKADPHGRRLPAGLRPAHRRRHPRPFRCPLRRHGAELTRHGRPICRRRAGNDRCPKP